MQSNRGYCFRRLYKQSKKTFQPYVEGTAVSSVYKQIQSQALKRIILQFRLPFVCLERVPLDVFKISRHRLFQRGYHFTVFIQKLCSTRSTGEIVHPRANQVVVNSLNTFIQITKHSFQLCLYTQVRTGE